MNIDSDEESSAASVIADNQQSDIESLRVPKISTRLAQSARPLLDTPPIDPTTSNKAFDIELSPTVSRTESGQKRPRQASHDSDKQSSDSSTDQEVLYCHCRRPDDGKFMIQCESCENWFHGRCVSMNREKSNRNPHWRCAECIDSGKVARRASTVPKKHHEIDSEESPAKKKQRSRKTQLINPPGGARPVPELSKLDQVRQRVIQNIEKVLESGKNALLNLSNKPSDDTKTPAIEAERDYDLPDDLHEVDVRNLAVDIEKALNDALSDEAYKAKFRTLHFNLKELKNACNVLSGKISPEQLISMSAEDLANEHLKLINDKIKRESLRESVLTEEMAVLLLKKTELTGKAKESVKKQDTTEQTAKVITSTVTPTGSGEPIILPTLPAQPAATENSEQQQQAIVGRDEMLSGQNVEGDSLLLVSPVAEEPVPQEDLPMFSPTVEQEETKDSNSLEALLAKVNAQKILVPVDMEPSLPPPSSDSVGSFEPDQFLASDHEPEHETIFFKDFAQVWSGKVFMEGTGAFQGTARFAGGTLPISEDEWKELLTPVLEIGGRINPQRVFSYLDDQVYNEARQISVATVEIESDTEENQTGYKSIWEYFSSRSRYAVVEKRLPKVKDLYLIPLSKTDTLPDFMTAIDHSIPTSERDSDALVAVIVHSKTSEIMAKKDSNSSSRRGSSVKTDKVDSAAIDQALSLLESIVPSSTANLAPTSNVAPPVIHQQNQNYYPPPQQTNIAPPMPPYGQTYGHHNVGADPRRAYSPPAAPASYEPQQYPRHHDDHYNQPRPSYRPTDPYYRPIAPSMGGMHPDRMRQLDDEDRGHDSYNDNEGDYRRPDFRDHGNDRRNSRGRGGGHW